MPPHPSWCSLSDHRFLRYGDLQKEVKLDHAGHCCCTILTNTRYKNVDYIVLEAIVVVPRIRSGALDS